MTSCSHRLTRRTLLGGILLLGACAPSRHMPDTDNIRPPAGRRTQLAAQRPQSYRLQPEVGQAPEHPAHPSIAYTLDSDAGRQIALTFDDGPDPVYTPEVLEVLRRHSVRATFCLVGENAVAHPRLLHEIADAGHEIANHTWSHPQLTRMRPADARRQLARTSDVIERTIGTPPTLARAPYGSWNARTLEIAAGLGMSPLGWSVDTRDWARPGIDKISATVFRYARPGAILLSHDGGGDRSQTATALAHYLPRLLDAGYTPVTPP